MNVFEKIRSLRLPPQQFVVIGGSALDCYGIRESGDIDLCITQELYEHLKSIGWKEEVKPNGAYIIHPDSQDGFELGTQWQYGNYHASTEELINRSKLINGINVAALEDIIDYKVEINREKDKKDIELINAYLRALEDGN